MKSIHYTLLTLLLYWKLPASSQAQDTLTLESGPTIAQREFVDHTYRPLTLKLTEDGSKYIRFLFWNQLWARATQNNPGTQGVEGNLAGRSSDVGLRRARVLAYAEISPKFLILTHWGINNQTFTNGGIPAGGFTGNAQAISPDENILVSSKKPALFFHDIWTEYKITDQLYWGMGLHYWNGISRMTSASTLNFMTLDAPIFNWPLIDLTDQFGRQFGFYAKGQVGKIDYRLAYNKPYSVGSGGSFEETTQRPIAANTINDNWASQGYLAYQFLDKENNKLPYFVGTYLGTKSVLNLGGGWHHHPGATSSRDSSGNLTRHDIRLMALDAFLDVPVNKVSGTALTVYSVYYNYDFGPNYIRNVGVMNVGMGAGSSQNGPGNAQPTIGTGKIWYTQAGYLLPEKVLGEDKGRLQPFGAYTIKNFDYFEQSTHQFDLGMNYFINSHQAKITLQYSQRPVFENYRKNGTAGELILQTQIFL
ncbi:MAG: porin [Lunatimonas sp.]|uniref:porin n=1 Tax=Lunatimonas sp. TaxID=2060141 RepID=UPI00263AF256|nr:porin [Lunatimonas sp.]MCC5937791.1 porin [Lunatimonas sp.]